MKWFFLLVEYKADIFGELRMCCRISSSKIVCWVHGTHTKRRFFLWQDLIASFDLYRNLTAISCWHWSRCHVGMNQVVVFAYGCPGRSNGKIENTEWMSCIRVKFCSAHERRYQISILYLIIIIHMMVQSVCIMQYWMNTWGAGGVLYSQIQYFVKSSPHKKWREGLTQPKQNLINS